MHCSCPSSLILAISYLYMAHSLFQLRYPIGNKWISSVFLRTYSILYTPLSSLQVWSVFLWPVYNHRYVTLSMISFLEIFFKTGVTKLHFWSSCRIFFMLWWRFHGGQMQRWRYIYTYVLQTINVFIYYVSECPSWYSVHKLKIL